MFEVSVILTPYQAPGVLKLGLGTDWASVGLVDVNLFEFLGRNFRKVSF